jgi:L-serine/L-threonine ammonia-lyase
MLLKKHYINTPLFPSPSLKSKYGLNVIYKMECYQPSGSFKIRGMDHFLKEIYSQGYKKVIASSGGNAGYSLAYVGNKMDIEVQIIVPESTSEYMINKIKLLGAEVFIYGKDFDEANAYAIQLSKESDLPFVSPFNHPLLWQGHSTLIDECAAEMKEPDRIIVAVGGGGLLCGIFEGLVRNNWLNTKVVTAETEGAASFAKSKLENKLITLSEINTIATSLGAKKITPKALEYASSFNVETYVTNDSVAFTACKDFFDEYHVLVEPACGAALSYLKAKHNEIYSNENILVIVCGGVNMGMEKYLEYAEKFK